MINTDKGIRTKYLRTLHGQKRNLGIAAEINGQKAIAYFEKEEIVGYRTLDEINTAFYCQDLPRYTVPF